MRIGIPGHYLPVSWAARGICRAMLVLALALGIGPSLGIALGAQEPASDSARVAAASAARRMVFLRAQRMVNDGNGAEGRALLDSLLNETEPRTPVEAEILFWRATIAESWEQAERDYLRVMLQHEGSPRAAFAMLRLAQGELARGDREAALRYLERLASEAPESPLRAEAALWQGRILLDRNQRLQGCAVLRAGRARVSAGSLELETQYEYLLRGCPAASDSTIVTPPPATPATEAPAAPAGEMVWSVQISARPTRAEAQQLVDAVRPKGYDARIDGTEAPFRVRFGRFATRDAAASAMAAYRQAERADAFLVQVPR